ncbi:MAG: sigma-70 family RNA polymerase sigma factor [Planctomycetota bacterium]
MTGETFASEESLVVRMRSGDDAAFFMLFERHVPDLRRRIDRWLSAAIQRKISISDVLQSTRIHAQEHCREFEDRGQGSFRNWILTIADWKAKDVVRRYTRAAKRDVQREVTRGQRADTGRFHAKLHSPSEAAMAAELADLARQAMNALPPDYREVLRLAREQGLALREVAERMGRSRDAAKKLYARALLRFKRAFEELTGS